MSNVIEDVMTPKNMADFVFSHEKSKSTLEEIIQGVRPFPAFGKTGILLHGPYGTGKTALAKRLPSLIENNRSGDPDPFINTYHCARGAESQRFLTGIENLSILVSPNRSRLNYVILDEVDNMHQGGQRRLKAVMNAQQVVYVLTTNHLDQVDKGVQDRCHLVPMFAAAPSKWVARCNQVIAACGAAPVPNAILETAIANCGGSAREIMNAAVEIAMKRGGSLPVAPSVSVATP